MTVSHHPPGDMPTGYQAGDIGLVRHWVVSALGEMIQAGETDAGLIVEANEAGIELRQISRYRDADLYIVHHRYICSGEVARATECYTDHGYPKAPEAMKPADLAAFYGLRMHEPPYPLSPFARILDLAATVGRLIGRFLKP